MPSLPWHIACPIQAFVEIELARRRFRARVLGNVGCLSGDGAAAGSEVHAPRVEGGRVKADMGRGLCRGRGMQAVGGVGGRGPAVSEMTFPVAVTLGPFGGVAASLLVSGGQAPSS